MRVLLTAAHTHEACHRALFKNTLLAIHKTQKMSVLYHPKTERTSLCCQHTAAYRPKLTGCKSCLCTTKVSSTLHVLKVLIKYQPWYKLPCWRRVQPQCNCSVNTRSARQPPPWPHRLSHEAAHIPCLIKLSCSGARQHTISDSESSAMSAVRYLEGGSDVAVLSVTVQQLRTPCTRYVVFTHWRTLLHIVHAA
jgi:hypothetical protein